MALYDRLHGIGEERFQKILNALMRGEPVLPLARLIQLQPPEGWGLFQGTPERTLYLQLIRLRDAAAEGAYGPEVAQQIIAGQKPQEKLLERVSVRALERLEELSDVQRERLLTQVEKEKLTKHVPGDHQRYRGGVSQGADGSPEDPLRSRPRRVQRPHGHDTPRRFGHPDLPGWFHRPETNL